MQRIRVRLVDRPCRLAIVIAIGAAVTAVAGADNVPEGLIDRRPLLSIGVHTVSSYLFDRYYRLFGEVWTSDHGRPPNEVETRQWLEHYLVQQAVIAHAMALGYAERPEVAHIVARMQRHMLLDPHGPLFERICATAPRSEKAVEELFADSARQLDGVVARFDEESAAAAVLGPDFEAQPLEEQLRRLQRGAKTGAVQLFEGRLAWPFSPFSEIARVLENGAPGQWIDDREPEFGRYLVYIRSIKTRSIGSFEHSRAGFERALQEIDRQVAYKRHRAGLQRQANVAIDEAALGRLFDVFQSAPPDASALPEPRDPALAGTWLYRYQIGGRRVSVSVEEFRRTFNDLIVHRFPSSVSELRALMTDQALDGLELTLPEAEQVASDPEFAERRAGFVGLQVLDLFERERLAPGIRISGAQIAQYFREHADEFQSATNVHGQLLAFASFEAAEAYCQQGRGGLTEGKGGPRPSTVREVEISAERPLPELARYQELLLRSREGRVIGPLQAGHSYFLFVRQRSGAPAVVPPSEVAEVIRQRLTRQAIDAKEAELATEWRKLEPIENRIDYQKLGLKTEDEKRNHAQLSGL